MLSAWIYKRQLKKSYQTGPWRYSSQAVAGIGQLLDLRTAQIS
jgi:hypothetical protein